MSKVESWVSRKRSRAACWLGFLSFSGAAGCARSSAMSPSLSNNWPNTGFQSLRERQKSRWAHTLPRRREKRPESGAMASSCSSRAGPRRVQLNPTCSTLTSSWLSPSRVAITACRCWLSRGPPSRTTLTRMASSTKRTPRANQPRLSQR
ncbi:hypothetical protein D3C71_1538080 [compost metagenome]